MFRLLYVVLLTIYFWSNGSDNNPITEQVESDPAYHFKQRVLMLHDILNAASGFPSYKEKTLRAKKTKYVILDFLR